MALRQHVSERGHGLISQIGGKQLGGDLMVVVNLGTVPAQVGGHFGSEQRKEWEEDVRRQAYLQAVPILEQYYGGPLPTDEVLLGVKSIHPGTHRAYLELIPSHLPPSVGTQLCDAFVAQGLHLPGNGGQPPTTVRCTLKTGGEPPGCTTVILKGNDLPMMRGSLGAILHAVGYPSDVTVEQEFWGTVAGMPGVADMQTMVAYVKAPATDPGLSLLPLNVPSHTGGAAPILVSVPMRALLLANGGGPALLPPLPPPLEVTTIPAASAQPPWVPLPARTDRTVMACGAPRQPALPPPPTSHLHKEVPAAATVSTTETAPCQEVPQAREGKHRRSTRNQCRGLFVEWLAEEAGVEGKQQREQLVSAFLSSHNTWGPLDHLTYVDSFHLLPQEVQRRFKAFMADKGHTPCSYDDIDSDSVDGSMEVDNHLQVTDTALPPPLTETQARRGRSSSRLGQPPPRTGHDNMEVDTLAVTALQHPPSRRRSISAHKQSPTPSTKRKSQARGKGLGRP